MWQIRQKETQRVKYWSYHQTETFKAFGQIWMKYALFTTKTRVCCKGKEGGILTQLLHQTTNKAGPCWRNSPTLDTSRRLSTLSPPQRHTGSLRSCPSRHLEPREGSNNFVNRLAHLFCSPDHHKFFLWSLCCSHTLPLLETSLRSLSSFPKQDVCVLLLFSTTKSLLSFLPTFLAILCIWNGYRLSSSLQIPHQILFSPNPQSWNLYLPVTSKAGPLNCSSPCLFWLVQTEVQPCLYTRASRPCN